MGDRSATPSRDRALAERAAGQFGVVAMGDLAAVGIDKRAAWRRARSGRLHRLHLGVYSVVPPTLLRPEGHWLAAVRAAGPDAVLSHSDAAALWDLRGAPTGAVHVTVPSAAGRRRRRGLVVHRCSSLARSDVDIRRGIPVTTVARTFRDLRRTTPAYALDAMVRRAERRGMDTGTRSADGEDDDTELERRLLALCRRHSLPRPRTQRVIGPFTVDFFWPEARLIVETDGFENHRTRSDFEGDRARDAWLTSRGYRVVRFTWRQLQDDPASVAATLHRVLDRRQ